MTVVMKKRLGRTQTARRKPLVVCVDDDPHIAKALRLRLKTMNVDILQASDGRAGLRLIRERKPDLVISDWWMERGDGEYLLNRLQSQPDTAQIPVIMVSGVGRSDFMSRMVAQGAQSCYTKPLQFDVLREDMCTLLDLEPSNGQRTRAVTAASRQRSRNLQQSSELIRLDRSEATGSFHWSN